MVVGERLIGESLGDVRRPDLIEFGNPLPPCFDPREGGSSHFPRPSAGAWLDLAVQAKLVAR
jgi:hypothetical protein